MDFIPHSQKQEDALFFTTPIGLLITGIQFGKTTIGSVWMKMKNHTYTDHKDNFLITSPTYKILSQSTLPPYLRFMDGYGKFSKSDMAFHIHAGGTVFFRTGTDPDSIVGITDIRAILCDEFGLYSLYFFQNILARAAFRNAQIMGVTSPYSLGWLYKDIVRPKLKDPSARSDVTLITARSDENPHFPKDVYERNKATMDPRRFNMIFGGQFERMSGLVYDCFDEDENICEPFVLPQGTRFFGGVDWGFTEPFVLKIRAITPSGHHYSVGEVYKSGLTITQIIEIARQKKQVFNIERFYCDPSQPGYIEEFNRNGLPAMGANNDIRVGIDRHYDLIKSRRFKIFKGAAPFTLDEMETYHYPDPEDLKPNQDAKEQTPVGQNDHAMDADRYVTMETYLGAGQRRHTPIVPGEDKKAESQHERIERIKKRRGYGSQTENWS